MKKHQIKLVGVCAATLLTVGALTPTVSSIAHAQEAGIETKALVQTENNLKPTVNMSVEDYYNNGFADFMHGLFATATPGQGKDVTTELVTEDDWKDIWNKPAAGVEDDGTSQWVSTNVGLKNVKIDLSTGEFEPVAGDRNALQAIVLKTDWLNTKEYKEGDKITLDFWKATSDLRLIGDSPIATSVITLTGITQDYDASAQNIVAAVGDQYLINQGVVVNNKDTGKALTYIDASLVDKLGGTGGVVNSDGDIVINGKTYDQGTWYTVQDITNNSDGDAAKPFNDSVAGNPDNDARVFQNTNPATNALEYTYNKTVNFDQTLKVIVFGESNDLADANAYFINRTIKVVDDKEVQPVPLYRAYNSNDGDHLFTTSNSEYLNVTSAGWAAEGIAWNAASSTADGGYVVYRLYNSNSGEHFYTASKAEYMNLGAAGWTQEGVGFNSPKADGNVAVYRAFNPNAKGPGSHMFTTSKSEYDNIVKAGWTPEGIAFYGLAEK